MHHAGARPPAREARVLEEGDVGAGASLLVGVEEVVDGRVVLVDRLLHEPQAEDARVEVHVPRGVGGDRRDVVDPFELHRRPSVASPSVRNFALGTRIPPGRCTHGRRGRARVVAPERGQRQAATATPATQRTPPETIDARIPASEATTPASEVAEQRPRRVAHLLDPGQASAQVVGDGRVPDRSAEDAADHVRPPAKASASMATPRFGRTRSAVIPTPQPTAAQITARPWRCTRPVQPLVVRRDQRADGGRGVQEPERARSAELLREGREERHRHPEEHGDHVDAVGADELRAAHRIAGSLRRSRAGSAAGLRAAAARRA